MDPEQFKTLIEWHRAAAKRLVAIEIAVALIFFFLVIVPMLKHYGIGN